MKTIILLPILLSVPFVSIAWHGVMKFPDEVVIDFASKKEIDKWFFFFGWLPYHGYSEKELAEYSEACKTTYNGELVHVVGHISKMHDLYSLCTIPDFDKLDPGIPQRMCYVLAPKVYRLKRREGTKVYCVIRKDVEARKVMI